MYNPRLSGWQKSHIIARYEDGISAYKIAEEICTSYGPVYSWLAHNGIQRRTRSECQRKYTFNRRFFQNINSETKAYVLGFLAADGYVIEKYRSVNITLSSKDRAHLLAISDLLECDAPLIDYSHGGYDMTRLSVVCEEMVLDLADQGITYHKTDTISWPDIHPNLWRHYIRGYIDGDGSFFVRKSKPKKRMDAKCIHIGCSIIGHRDFLALMQVVFIEACELNKTKILTDLATKRAYRLRYHGNGVTLRIANYLYEGATIFLPRKRDIVLNHYRALPKYCDQLRFG